MEERVNPQSFEPTKFIFSVKRTVPYFRLSPLQKHARKVVGGFEKKSCVSTGVRKPGNTYASQTSMIWP